MVLSVGVVIEASKDKMVLTGGYSSPGDELDRLTRIPTSMVRPVLTLEKKPSPVLAEEGCWVLG